MGGIYWKTFQCKWSINTYLDSKQLQRAADTIVQKRPELNDHFLHDEAWQCVGNLTFDKLLALEWEVFHHPPYSPNLAPAIYCLFLNLQNLLDDKMSETDDEIKTGVGDHFNSKRGPVYILKVFRIYPVSRIRCSKSVVITFFVDMFLMLIVSLHKIDKKSCVGTVSSL